jgi:hypothetical protein
VAGRYPLFKRMSEIMDTGPCSAESLVAAHAMANRLYRIVLTVEAVLDPGSQPLTGGVFYTMSGDLVLDNFEDLLHDDSHALATIQGLASPIEEQGRQELADLLEGAVVRAREAITNEVLDGAARSRQELGCGRVRWRWLVDGEDFGDVDLGRSWLEVALAFAVGERVDMARTSSDRQEVLARLGGPILHGDKRRVCPHLFDPLEEELGLLGRVAVEGVMPTEDHEQAAGPKPPIPLEMRIYSRCVAGDTQATIAEEELGDRARQYQVSRIKQRVEGFLGRTVHRSGGRRPLVHPTDPQNLDKGGRGRRRGKS